MIQAEAFTQRDGCVLVEDDLKDVFGIQLCSGDARIDLVVARGFCVRSARKGRSYCNNPGIFSECGAGLSDRKMVGSQEDCLEQRQSLQHVYKKQSGPFCQVLFCVSASFSRSLARIVSMSVLF